MRKAVETVNKTNALIEAINSIQEANPEIKNEEEKKKELSENIVDIMTFCDDPRYLNLPGNNFHLFDTQRLILKCFYMGTRGNETLKLTQEEWKWLYDNEKHEELDNVVYENNIKDVIKKLLKKEKEPFNFRELHLVLGRRSSKTIMASIISAYEVYKLLTINNGDPHGFYHLPDDDEIAVINVALSQNQAGRLFGQIQSRLRNAPFFAGRIAKETTSEIRLYTTKDLEKKRKGSILNIPGSVLILCGHSNPDTLAGYNAILILFDELAFYEEGGKTTGRHFYDRLKPSLSHFFKYGDGRLVEISSPNAMAGIFYDIFDNSTKFDHILSFQLPTWTMNPTIAYDNPDLASDRARNPDAFAVEYGAQWSRSGTFGHYFPPDLIDRCLSIGITKGCSMHLRPEPKFNYYLHVDPAINTDRYVAVLVAKEIYLAPNGKKRARCRLARTWTWESQPGIGLQYSQINRDILGICAAYRPVVVSYDQCNSEQSLQFLRGNGVHVVQTAFNRSFKNKIYQNLREMMAYQPEPELWLYEDPRLILEMRSLKYRPTVRGVSLVVDKHGEVKTDDLIDCLCGAVAMGSENIRPTLPSPVLVRTGWL